MKSRLRNAAFSGLAAVVLAATPLTLKGDAAKIKKGHGKG